MPSIKEKGRNDQKLIDNWYNTHSYQHFKPGLSLKNGTSPIIHSYDLGCIYNIDTFGSGKQFINMVKFDNNLHTSDTAKYNLGIHFAQKQLDDLQNPDIQYTPGLSAIVYNGGFNKNKIFYKNNFTPILTQTTISNLSSFNSIISNTHNTDNLPKNVLIEVFGYFMMNTSGNITLNCSDTGHIWIGPHAITNYNISNVNTTPITVKANIYNPIRIQCGYSQFSESSLLSLTITKGSTAISPSMSIFYSSSLNSKPWEPFQLHYSLTPSNSLFTINIVDHGTMSNFEYNNNIRNAFANPNTISYWASSSQFIPKSSMLVNSFDLINSLTNNKFISCKMGNEINIQNIQLNGKTYTNTDPKWSSFVSPQNQNSVIVTLYSVSNKTSDALINYTIGSVSFQKKVPRSTPNQRVTISSQSQVDMCNLVMTLTTSGDLTISNRVNSRPNIVWSLSKNLKIVLPTNASVSHDWHNLYKSSAKDLSILNMNESIGSNATHPYLISSDGRFIMYIINSTIQLAYTIENCNSKNSISLYGIASDPKINQVLYADSNTQTLSTISSDILKYSNKFNTISASPVNMLYPPMDISSSDPGSVKYTKYSNITSKECNTKCTDQTNPICTHTYFYTDKTKNKNTHCLVNTDGQEFRLYSNNSSVNTSSINTRKYKIQSNCGPSNNHTKFPNALNINSVDSAYSDFSMYSLSPQVLTTDGICNQKWFSSGWTSSKPITEGMIPGFDNTPNGCDGPTANYTTCAASLQSNINALKTASIRSASNTNDLGTNFLNLNNSIGEYNILSEQVNTSAYDAIDNNGNLTFKYDNNNPSPNINDVLLNDSNDSLTQQNLLYITASITVATLIVAAIIISRK